MRDYLDIVEEKFNKLTVKSIIRRGRRVYAACVCECGNLCEIRVDCLEDGNTKSCGCLKKEEKYKIIGTENLLKSEAWKLRKLKHGKSIRGKVTKEYEIYCGMKARCYNEKSSRYKDYGGRGIKICERWLDKENGFQNFIDDMGECPIGYSIERINNDGNYEPENCKWIPLKDQAKNRRSSKRIVIDGVEKLLEDWCIIFNRNSRNVSERINKYGWDEILAILTPTNKPYIERN